MPYGGSAVHCRALDDAKKKALDLWEEGQVHHIAGDLERAVSLYKKSIGTCPTAEAHTFLGWAYSFKGDLDGAIAECKRAIEVDPTFGNPYNDIGSYLMKQGHLDEAIGWLEKAKDAPRYEPRHFPHMNLGRIYVRLDQIAKAIDEFDAALAIEPNEPTCRDLVAELRRLLN